MGRSELADATIVLTRRQQDVAELALRLETLGARTIFAPLIRFAAPTDTAALNRARAELADQNWVVLTSRYAARALLADLAVPETQQLRIAVLGHSTAEVVRDLGWPVHVDGGGVGADALARLLCRDHGLDGARVLYPCSSLARSRLPSLLSEAGAVVTKVVAYQTLAPDAAGAQQVLDALEATGAVFMLASPSAVNHLDEILLAREHAGGVSRAATWQELSWVSIGPTTSRALRAVGVTTVYEAPQPDDDGLLAAIGAALAAR